MSIDSLKHDLTGKKLLILGGSIDEYDLVRRAKELGIYTIVTDYNDIETSPAKKIADEYWSISWADLDALELRCREEHIDGITAGYSESRVDRCIRLCSRLGFPCYCTQQQLDILKNKKLFKEECRKYGVPVVREYTTKEDVENFPVIVKPVDRGGSIGVGVASNRQELDVVYEYAMEMSFSKEVIIEDFICWGTKFDAFYVITDGVITFLSASDTINAKNNGVDKVVQSGWTLPSRHEKAFVSAVEPRIRDMISGMGIQNGFLFFSGFSDGEHFVFFETGFRLSGGHMYRFFEANGMPDIQDVFIQHALLGNSEGICFRVGALKKRALIINYYAKAGKLSKLQGLSEIEKIPECEFVIPMCKIGTDCQQDKAILTKLAMIHLYSDDVEKLLQDMELVNSMFVARDETGNDMVYDRMHREEIQFK